MITHVNSYFFGSASRLWFVFILGGLFVLISPYYIEIDVSTMRIIPVGCVSIFIGITLKFNYAGTQIDTAINQYREFTSVFGIKTGNWSKLPKFKKVVLSSEIINSRNTPNGISPTFSGNITYYTIALYSDAPHTGLFLKTEKEKYAKDKAALLAKMLRLQLIENL